MFSCGLMLRLQADTIKRLQGLGPAIGVASAETLQQHVRTPQMIKVKWPNDLMVGDGKLAGILVQTSIKGSDLLVVVGMGLNLRHAQRLSDRLSRDVAQLSALVDNTIDYANLAAELARSWQQAVHQCAQSSFQGFQMPFKALDYLANQSVNVLEQGVIIDTGQALGLTPQGCLQIQTQHGLRTLNVGDVSVRIRTP